MIVPYFLNQLSNLSVVGLKIWEMQPVATQFEYSVIYLLCLIECSVTRMLYFLPCPSQCNGSTSRYLHNSAPKPFARSDCKCAPLGPGS